MKRSKYVMKNNKKILIGASGYSETEKDLGRVLFLYNQAAKKYFKITNAQ